MSRPFPFPRTVAACILLLSFSAPVLAPVGTVRAATPAAATTRYVLVASESEALYRVNEVLFREGNRLNIAVGRTRECGS